MNTCGALKMPVYNTPQREPPELELPGPSKYVVATSSNPYGMIVLLYPSYVTPFGT